MRGEILSYDAIGGEGLISGDDLQRYSFSRVDVGGGQEPVPGLRVDFLPLDDRAAQIIPLLVQASGLSPKNLIYADIGGQTPQAMVNELAGEIHRGEIDVVVIAAGEAIGSGKRARKAGVTLDWNQPADRDFDQLPPPPFQRSARGRRNPARMWTMIAAAVAVLLVGATAALAWFGVPDSVARLMPFAPAAQPDLVIELPPNQDHRELADGTIYFAASGVIINPTDREQRVPPILAELRDAQGTIVYSWTIKPPVRMLPPNEKVNFSEAKLDIPRRATQLTVSWALPKG